MEKTAPRVALIKSDVLGFCALCGCVVTLAIAWLLMRQIDESRARIRELEAGYHAREIALIEVVKTQGKAVPDSLPPRPGG